MLCVFPHSAVGWSVIVAFPHFPGLILTCFFVLSVMLYQGILLTEHFQRLGCVMNNQNEIGCDAYAAKSLSSGFIKFHLPISCPKLGSYSCRVRQS